MTDATGRTDQAANSSATKAEAAPACAHPSRCRQRGGSEAEPSPPRPCFASPPGYSLRVQRALPARPRQREMPICAWAWIEVPHQRA